MITKATIMGKSSESPYKYKVNIPLLNKLPNTAGATPVDELLDASVCIFGNSANVFEVGDVVFVGFEDHDASKPVILGKLYLGDETSGVVLKSTSLEVNESTQGASYAKLPKNTTIGQISADSINALQGLGSSNLEQRLRVLESWIND